MVFVLVHKLIIFLRLQDSKSGRIEDLRNHRLTGEASIEPLTHLLSRFEPQLPYHLSTCFFDLTLISVQFTTPKVKINIFPIQHY